MKARKISLILSKGKGLIRSMLMAIIPLFLPGIVFCQTVKGIVYQDSTNKGIANASIYVSGTMSGVQSDDQGRFELLVSQHKPLTVSCTGYYSSVIDWYKPGELLLIHLRSKTTVLNEVTIRPDDMPSAEKLKMFKREFLGTSKFAAHCQIVNESEIDLRFNKKTKTLTAFCTQPIIIKNEMLGYTVKYYLDMFTYSPLHVRIQGNYSFSDAIPGDGKAAKLIAKYRSETYKGSRMEFVRSLWHRQLTHAGFRLYDRNYKKIDPDSIMLISDGKYICIKGTAHIVYNADFNNISYIKTNSNLAFIDKDGFYTSDLTWGGPMSVQRMGDLLPFEYESDDLK